MRVFLKTGVILLAFACLTACQPSSPYAKIDSFAKPDLLQDLNKGKYKKTYFLATSIASQHELEYKENEEFIRQSLKYLGYTNVENIKDADFLITVEFALSKAEEKDVIKARPVFGQTGSMGSTSHSTIIGNSIYTTTSNIPSYGVTGYVPYQTTEIFQTASLDIYGYDAHAVEKILQNSIKNKKEFSMEQIEGTMLWAITVTKLPNGGYINPRTALKPMFVLGAGYIGTKRTNASRYYPVFEEKNGEVTFWWKSFI